MSYISTIKESCGGSDKTSSKRVVMYHFVYVAIFMVLIQAFFTLILIWKWAHATEMITLEVHSIFPDVVWYCVFGIIGGIAGVNGIQNGFGKQKEVKPKEEEIN